MNEYQMRFLVDDRQRKDLRAEADRAGSPGAPRRGREAADASGAASATAASAGSCASTCARCSAVPPEPSAARERHVLDPTGGRPYDRRHGAQDDAAPCWSAGRGLLDQLAAVLRATRDGEPRHAVIGGEAGVGKTRLLAAIAELAERAGLCACSSGRCVSMGEAGLPFAPYTEILRSSWPSEGVRRGQALAGRAAGDLARLVPALGTDDGAPASGALGADAAPRGAPRPARTPRGERRPLLLQLEDLHWADAGTLSATAYLLRAVQGAPSRSWPRSAATT